MPIRFCRTNRNSSVYGLTRFGQLYHVDKNWKNVALSICIMNALGPLTRDYPSRASSLNLGNSVIKECQGTKSHNLLVTKGNFPKERWRWCSAWQTVSSNSNSWTRPGSPEYIFIQVLAHLKSWFVRGKLPLKGSFTIFLFSVRIHILDSNEVWYSWFWSEGSINTLNPKFLGFYFVPTVVATCDLISRRQRPHLAAATVGTK